MITYGAMLKPGRMSGDFMVTAPDYRSQRPIDLWDELKTKQIFISPTPLPQPQETYYLVGNRRFDHNNLSGATWYRDKLRARGKKVNVKKITAYENLIEDVR